MLQLTIIIFVKYLLKFLFYSSQKDCCERGIERTRQLMPFSHGTGSTKPRLKCAHV